MRDGGGNCLKYLKRGWNRTEEIHKDFKNGGKLGQGVSALKGGGLEPPYELCLLTYLLIGLSPCSIFLAGRTKL